MYLAFKLVHIVAVILFLGNITTGLFWKTLADRTRDLRIIAYTMDGIIRSDRLFTIPGVVVIFIGGLGAAIVGRLPILGTGWILWAIILFTISGLAFMVKVAPLQVCLLALARGGNENPAFDWHRYHALSREWEVWGLIALLTPAAAMVLMVLKPAL